MMRDNSFVAMGQHLCPVCGKTHDSGEILLHKNLRPIQDDKRVTGYGLCPDDQKLFDDGYIALVEAKGPAYSNNLKMEDAYRTGKLAHLKREAFSNVFNVPAPADLPMVFVEPGVIDQLAEMSSN